MPLKGHQIDLGTGDSIFSVVALTFLLAAQDNNCIDIGLSPVLQVLRFGALGISQNSRTQIGS